MIIDIRFYLDGNPMSDIQKEYLGNDAHFILNKIRSFIIQRLNVLSEEIKKEPNGFIVVDIEIQEIRYYFSESIALKMINSISEDDFRHEMTKIYFDLNQQ